MPHFFFFLSDIRSKVITRDNKDKLRMTDNIDRFCYLISVLSALSVSSINLFAFLTCLSFLPAYLSLCLDICLLHVKLSPPPPLFFFFFFFLYIYLTCHISICLFACLFLSLFSPPQKKKKKKKSNTHTHTHTVVPVISLLYLQVRFFNDFPSISP